MFIQYFRLLYCALQPLTPAGRVVHTGGGAGLLPVGGKPEGAGAADPAGCRHYGAVRDALRQVTTSRLHESLFMYYVVLSCTLPLGLGIV